MEDLDFSQRLKRRGAALVRVPLVDVGAALPWRAAVAHIRLSSCGC